MVSYIVRRLLIAIPTLIGVATIIFLLLHLIPGDPARVIAGPQATQADVNHLREQLGLNLPLWQQYLNFLWGIAHGNLGTSFATGGPVMDQISSRFPFTLELAVLSMCVALVVGVALGVFAALRQNSPLDLLISALAVFGVSMPVFWTGLLLIVLFAVNLHLLPAAGAESPQSYILPTLTLAFFSVGFIARQTRGAMLDVLSLDYVRTARAKGASRFSVLIRHGLRNALLPIVTAAGLQFGQLLGGAVLTETIYSWPGMGQYLVNSINSRDYVAVQGTVFLFALGVILVNLITDLVYAYIDPRIRYD
ncbi:MAG: ABC transporter permease [Candidatus Dormibacteraeota bacterium]|nr:ABC transporter permease [Candidatus Dormibacteraeota bacterium]MBO0745668.1 ABC transporter permease [Candidatus Dormibacteraeota bacterium]